MLSRDSSINMQIYALHLFSFISLELNMIEISLKTDMFSRNSSINMQIYALQLYSFISLELNMIETIIKSWYVQQKQFYEIGGTGVVMFMREWVISRTKYGTRIDQTVAESQTFVGFALTTLLLNNCEVFKEKMTSVWLWHLIRCQDLIKTNHAQHRSLCGIERGESYNTKIDLEYWRAWKVSNLKVVISEDTL